MHKRILFFSLIVFLSACTSKPSANILSVKKMTEIITDLQLADAAYKLELLPDTYKGQPQKYFLEILSSHQTDSATYNKSMIYYAENPKQLKSIYSAVEKNIQKRGLTK